MFQADLVAELGAEPERCAEPQTSYAEALRAVAIVVRGSLDGSCFTFAQETCSPASCFNGPYRQPPLHVIDALQNTVPRFSRIQYYCSFNVLFLRCSAAVCSQRQRKIVLSSLGKEP